jgi:hypothetical protein
MLAETVDYVTGPDNIHQYRIRRQHASNGLTICIFN